jgi:hypothetical protein
VHPGQLPLRFDQRFHVVRYGIGHSELELRSTNHNAPGSDFVVILFFAVRGIKLRVSFPTLEIRQANPVEAEEMLTLSRLDPARARKHGFKTVALSAGDGADSLVCCQRFSVWRRPPGWKRFFSNDNGSVLLHRS